MIITNLDDIPKHPGIYVMFSPNSLKKPYVGSSMNLWNRFNTSYKYYYKSNKNLPIINSIKKYGLEKFKIEIFHWWETPIDKLEVLALETATIIEYDCLVENGGYNVCIFANSRAGVKSSKTTKQKISNSKKGENHHFYGKHFSERHKKKIGDANRGKKNGMYGRYGKLNGAFGRKHTEEEKTKISVSKTGKGHSAEHCKKISDANKGEKHWFYGKKQSQETINKIRKTLKGKMAGEKHPCYDHTIYTFKHKINEEIFVGTRFNFCREYNLQKYKNNITAMVIYPNRYKSAKNWTLIPNAIDYQI